MDKSQLPFSELYTNYSGKQYYLAGA